MRVEQNTKPVCVGRHLIDLPVDFEQVLPIVASLNPSGTSDGATSIDLRVRALDFTLASFDKAVQKRQSEIAAFADDTTDILKEVLKTKPGETLFRILRIKEAYSSELHLLREKSYLTVSADSYRGRFLNAEELLSALANEIIPSEQFSRLGRGFCLGAVILKGVYEGELANFAFKNIALAGIVIKIEIDTYKRDPRRTLLQRVSGPDSLLKIFDARNKVLREGERTVAGMRAQEWLSTVMLGEHREKKQVAFALETMRPNPGPENPHIRVELNVTQENPTLSDQQLIELWDSIIRTIRLAGPSDH